MTTHSRPITRLLAGALGLALAGLAAATPVVQPVVTVESADAALRQQLQDELHAVLMRLSDSGAFERSSGEALAFEQQARAVADLGAVLDVRATAAAERDGLAVLAVTPGGTAAALGLRPGDRVVAVGDVPLRGQGIGPDGRLNAVAQLREALDTLPEPLRLEVLRDGQPLSLEGPLRVVVLPGYRFELGSTLAQLSLAGAAADGCGRISIEDFAPRKQKIYPATLIEIDGRSAIPLDSRVFRVTPGTHVLTVGERIDPREFNSTDQRQRTRLTRDWYKTLTVEVEPGMTYRLGARLVMDQRHEIRSGAYWEPVIYAEKAESCR